MSTPVGGTPLERESGATGAEPPTSGRANRRDRRRAARTSAGVEGRSPLRIAADRLVHDKVALLCLVVVAVFVLLATFAGVICDLVGVSLERGRPTDVLNIQTLLPLEGPPNGGFDPDHPFGLAPQSGNDNLAYWLYGARTSLSVAGMATLLATLIGVTLGLLAGFLGGWVDRVISFVTDFFLTIPFLLAALVLAPIINQRFAINPDLYARVQFWGLVAILAGFGWMSVARLVRGEVLSLREREFVQAARVLGMPTRRILVKELLPNLAAPIVVSVSLMLPVFVASEAALAFLGLGITTGQSWGQTILRATDYFELYPLFLWEPLVGIVVLVIALNLLGDAIRDALDPKTRR